MSRRAAVALAALAVALTGCGAVKAPADRADSLVPADALAYLHLSTDSDREQDRDLYRRLERFPALAKLEGAVERAFGRGLDIDRDVRPWLGREAAIALGPRGTLVLLDVADRARAQGVLTRVAGARPAIPHGGLLVQRFRGGAAAFVGGFLAIGAEPLVDAAIDLATGRARDPLAALPAYRRAIRGRPADRVVEAWARPEARAALGAAARRLPAAVTAFNAAPVEGGIRLRARLLDTVGATFAPDLLQGAGDDAVAYLGMPSLDPLLRLLPREAAPLVRAIAPVAGQPDVAIAVTPAQPDPVVTLSARAPSAAAARDAQGTLQERVASLLAGSEAATGQVPTFDEVDIGGGIDGFALRLAGGGELVSAVKGRRIAVSNAQHGVEQALGNRDGLRETQRFKQVVSDVPARAEALGYVDLSQLLALAERAGLTGARAYEAAREDLRTIRTLGAVVRRQGTDTTAELVLHLQ